MEQDQVLVCGGPRGLAAQNVTLDKFARLLGAHDDAWAALYGAIRIGKPVAFTLDNSKWIVKAADPQLEGHSANAIGFTAVPLDNYQPVQQPAAPADDRPKPLTHQPLSPRRDGRPGRYKCHFHMKNDRRFAAHVIVDARSDSDAEIMVRDSTGAFTDELRRSLADSFRGFRAIAEDFEFAGIERVDDG